ncbi:hypothetical protein Taro_023796 [Colocasia esculenta]|uniref:BED-type domain-containing protein n=1 Tax=Colocasia esculenta TaxID=4460 RepID=A0A843V4Q0_COLES|nr:hypothetical protein [Colocasia esculenta]
MRHDLIRYCRIGFDSADTLKGVDRCAAKGTVQSRFAAQQAGLPFLSPPRFQFFPRKNPRSACQSTSGGFLREFASIWRWIWRHSSLVLQMASKKGSDDIGWQHGVMLGSRHNFKCNYCSFTGQGGGVSRLKKHLAGGRLAGYHDMQGCKMVPSEVKKLMIEHLKHVRPDTARKRADKEIQERIISGRERDEDIEDEVEMYAEYVQERRARAQSRAEAWEGEQRVAHIVSFQGAQHEVGSGSGSGSAVGGSGPAELSLVDFQMWVIISLGPLPHKHNYQNKEGIARDPQGLKYKVGRAIAKWWHHTWLPFNAANSPYYKTAIQEVQRGGLHVQPPTARDLAGKYLQDEVNEIKSYIRFKMKWEKYGVTLMCDGWLGITRSSLINFLVYCDRQVFYHKSVDASDRVHNYEYILSLMREVVEEIGEQYIVQVVTDNGSAYKKAGEELMKIYPHLYWTPCAAHCVDLMLKEIGTLQPVKMVVDL